MKPMLKSYGALMVLVLTNVFVFAGVFWNRSGEPTGVMVFNQCELDSFTSGWGNKRSVRNTILQPHSVSVDEEIAKKLGISVEDDQDRWRNRRLYVVLKKGGQEWEDHVASIKRKNPKSLRYLSKASLMLIDGGTDPQRLSSTYPDAEGRAIVPGYLGRKFTSEDGGPFRWVLLEQDISLESAHRDMATEIREARWEKTRNASQEAKRSAQKYEEPPCVPTHRITVKWGQRYEPWVSSIERL